MATQAKRQSITPLSELIRDPFVRAAFRRAERDQGGALQVQSSTPEPLLPVAGEAFAAAQ